MSLAFAPLARHLLPPQPKQGIFSHFMELSQMGCKVMLLHSALRSRQVVPPQPAHETLKAFSLLAQYRGEEMSAHDFTSSLSTSFTKTLPRWKGRLERTASLILSLPMLTADMPNSWARAVASSFVLGSLKFPTCCLMNCESPTPAVCPISEFSPSSGGAWSMSLMGLSASAPSEESVGASSEPSSASICATCA